MPVFKAVPMKRLRPQETLVFIFTYVLALKKREIIPRVV